MIINTYNPANMSLVDSDVTTVDFGDVVKSQHNSESVVLRPILESGDTFSQLVLYLESAGNLGSSQFGKYKNSEAVTGILPGGSQLESHFTLQEGISDFTDFELTSDAGLILDTTTPEYIWLDTQAGTSAPTGDAQVNFRFVFEYF